MEIAYFIRVLLALVFVMGLIGVSAVLWRKFAWEKGMRWGTAEKRLRQVDSLLLDGRRRLVLVAKDDRELLLLLGASGETVLSEGPARKESSEEIIDNKNN